MKRTLYYVFLGILLYILFLLATFPTKLAVDTINENVPGLLVSDVSGSLWSGNAGMIKVQNFQLSDISWSFSFMTLFTGKLGVDLIIKDRDIKGKTRVAVGPGGKFVASNVNLTLPIDMISEQLRRRSPNMRGIDVRGTLKTDIDELVLQNNMLSHVEGKLDIRSLHVNATNRRLMLEIDETFGDYKLDFTTDPSQKIKVDIKGNKDVLKLEAKGELSKDKSYSLQGSISSDLPNKLIIISALPIMKPAAAGRKSFDLKGNLP